MEEPPDFPCNAQPAQLCPSAGKGSCSSPKQTEGQHFLSDSSLSVRLLFTPQAGLTRPPCCTFHVRLHQAPSLAAYLAVCSQSNRNSLLELNCPRSTPWSQALPAYKYIFCAMLTHHLGFQVRMASAVKTWQGTNSSWGRGHQAQEGETST